MKRLIKIVTTLLAILLITLVSITLLLPALINPNNYKQAIVNTVHDKTGLHASINGKMEWSLFPHPAFAISDVSVNDVNSQLLAAIDHAEINIALIPLLLSQKVNVHSLVLHDATLNISIDEQGNPNWLAYPSTVTNATVETEKLSDNENGLEEGSEEETHSSLPINIASMELSNAKLTYTNLKNAQKISVSQLNISAGSKGGISAFEIKSTFNINTQKPTTASTIRATAVVNNYVSLQQFELDDVRISLFAQNQLKPEKILISTNGIIQNGIYAGQLALEKVDVVKAMQQIGIPLSFNNEQALRAVSLYSQIHASSDSAYIDNIKLMLDQSKVQGHIKLVHTKEHPALSIDLSADNFNIDNYQLLPPASNTSSDDKTPQKKKQNDKNQPQKIPASGLIPAVLLTNKQADINLHIIRLIANGLQLEDVRFTANVNNDIATINELSANAYEGAINAHGQLNTQIEPVLTLNADIKNIDLQKLATDKPEFKRLSGKINATAELNAKGTSYNELIQSLNGKIKYNLTDGALLNLNLDHMLCKAIAKIRKKSLSKESWDKDTTFEKLEGSLVISNGIAKNNDLIAALGTAQLTGKGNIDLTQQMIDYTLGFNISGSRESREDSACAINDRYAHIIWPLRCKGRLTDDNLCQINYEQLIQELTGSSLQKIEEKVKNKLGDRFNAFFK